MCILGRVLYIINFLMWFTRALQSQSQSSGYCGTREPVIKVCADGELILQTSVNIDTDNVPRFQSISCKCTISPSYSDVEFMFTYMDETKAEHTRFEINEAVLDANTDGTTNIELPGKTELAFVISVNTTTARVCLIVSTGQEETFNITCQAEQSEKNIVPIPSTSDSTGGVTGVTGARTDPENEDGSDSHIIIPVVSATAGVVCLAGIVVVTVVCRRRSMLDKHESDAAAVGVENEDDYYMTENPMYNVTETQPKIQCSESEIQYHYIEPDNKGDRKSSNQYESLPDSQVRKQFLKKHVNPDLHYDYTTCVSASQKNEPVSQNKIDENKAGDNGEIMYDHTDAAVAKHFVSVNEYHHISPAASMKKAAVDTYNTIGNANNKAIDNEETVEDSHYDVTNLQ